MRTLLAISTLLIFVSCTSTENLKSEEIVGKYLWSPVYGINSTVEFKSDLTFEYKWQYGLISGTTFGTWEREEENVVLNSSLQPPRKAYDGYDIVKIEKVQSDSLFVKIVGENDEGFPFVSCLLKKDTTSLMEDSTDYDGETKLPRLGADSIIISYVGYKTIRHSLDSSVTSYTFAMEEAFETYRYFTDEKWKYENDRLYDPTIKEDEEMEKDYLEKIK